MNMGDPHLFTFIREITSPWKPYKSKENGNAPALIAI